MRKNIKRIYRGNEIFKPLREFIFQFNEEFITKQRFLAVRIFHCDCCMIVDTNDSYGLDVARSGKIESPEDEYLKKILRKEDVILDIGAHWGGFSLLFGSIVKGYGKVLAFEASKKNFKILKKNLKINKLLDCVTPFNYAVGNYDGIIEFPLSKTSSGHNSLVRKDIPILGYDKIEQIKLDEFLIQKNVERVNFIKIDIEGYELEALKGLESTIKRSEDLKMFVEFSPSFMGEGKSLELLDFLKHNFKDVYICHKKKIFKTSWKDAYKISLEKGQRNLFLFK